MGEPAIDLLDHVFTPATYAKYEKHWADYLEFVLDFDHCFSELSITEYIKYLFYCGYKHNTIAGRLAAISNGLRARHKVDFTKAYYPMMVLKGVKCFTKIANYRQPFTQGMVNQLIQALPLVYNDPYMVTLFSTIFSWAFHGCMRVSQYTQVVTSDHNLRIFDIARTSNGQLGTYHIRFQSYKHSPENIPEFIMVPTGDISCPIQTMDDYLAVRPKILDELFVDHYGPVTRLEVDNTIGTCCQKLGWDINAYEPHSLHIGRATAWMQQGYSPVQIMHMGRWRSQAYQVYIRPPVVLMP